MASKKKTDKKLTIQEMLKKSVEGVKENAKKADAIIKKNNSGLQAGDDAVSRLKSLAKTGKATGGAARTGKSSADNIGKQRWLDMDEVKKSDEWKSAQKNISKKTDDIITAAGKKAAGISDVNTVKASEASYESTKNGLKNSSKLKEDAEKAAQAEKEAQQKAAEARKRAEEGRKTIGRAAGTTGSGSLKTPQLQETPKAIMGTGEAKTQQTKPKLDLDKLLHGNQAQTNMTGVAARTATPATAYAKTAAAGGLAGNKSANQTAGSVIDRVLGRNMNTGAGYGAGNIQMPQAQTVARTQPAGQQRMDAAQNVAMQNNRQQESAPVNYSVQATPEAQTQPAQKTESASIADQIIRNVMQTAPSGMAAKGRTAPQGRTAGYQPAAQTAQGRKSSANVAEQILKNIRGGEGAGNTMPIAGKVNAAEAARKDAANPYAGWDKRTQQADALNNSLTGTNGAQNEKSAYRKPEKFGGTLTEEDAKILGDMQKRIQGEYDRLEDLLYSDYTYVPDPQDRAWLKNYWTQVYDQAKKENDDYMNSPEGRKAYKEWMASPEGQVYAIVTKDYISEKDFDKAWNLMLAYPDKFGGLKPENSWQLVEAYNDPNSNFRNLIEPKYKSESAYKMETAEKKLAQLEDAGKRWEGADRWYNYIDEGHDSSYHGLSQEAEKARQAANPRNYDERGHGVSVNDSTRDVTVHDVYLNANEKKVKTAAYYMTPEMTKVFNVYYNQGRYEEAMVYYNQLCETYLNHMATESIKESVAEAARDPIMGPLTGIGSVLINLAETPIALATTAQAIFDPSMRDTDNPMYTTRNATNTTQEERIKSWGWQFYNWSGGDENWRKVGEFFGGVAYSMMQNGAAIAASGGNVALVQLIMSSQATTSRFMECMENGMDVTEAAVLSVGDGIIEAITEKYSLEALLKPDVKGMLASTKGLTKWKEVAKFLGKNVLAEGSEEGASDVLNYFLDEIVSGIAGHEDQIRQNAKDLYYDQFLQEEMKNYPNDYGKAQSEAMRRAESAAIEDWWKTLAKDMAAGGVSGLGMAGMNVMSSAFANYGLGRQMEKNAARNERALGAKAENRNIAKENQKNAIKADTDFLIDTGMKLNKDSAAYKQALQLRVKEMAGKDITTGDRGKLARNIMMETGEQIATHTKDAMERVLVKQLAESGMNADEASEMSGIIFKAYTQGIAALNKSERAALDGSRLASNIYFQMTEPGKVTGARSKVKAEAITSAAQEAVKTETKESAQARNDTVRVLKGLGPSMTKNLGLVGSNRVSARDTAKIASDETVAAATAGRTVTNAANEVIAAGKLATIERFKDGKVIVRTEDGEESVDYSDIEGIKGVSNEAAVLTAYMHDNPGMMSEAMAGKAMASLAAMGDKAGGTYADDVARINMASRIGAEMPKNLSIDKETAQALFKQGQEDAAEAEANRISKTGPIAPGKGKAAWDGVEVGTTDWAKKAAESLTDDQRQEAELIAAFAKVTGFNINFVYDTDNKGTDYWGEANAENGLITVNLAAELKQKNSRGEVVSREMGSLLAAVSHEATHWLQYNSTDGYNRLKTFVLSNLTKSGVNLDARIKDTMERYNKFYKEEAKRKEAANPGTKVTPQVMTIDDAVYEIVADGCDQLLRSQEVANRLKETDQTLFGEIKGFVQDLVTKFSDAIKSRLIRTGSYYGRMISDVDEMARIWLGAYDETIHNYVTEEQETYGRYARTEAPAEVTTITPEEMKRRNQEATRILKETGDMPGTWGKDTGATFEAETAEDENDVRYKLADQSVRGYLTMWADWHLQDNDQELNKLLKKYGISAGDISGTVMAENRLDQYGISKADQKKIAAIQKDTQKWQDKRMDAMGLDEDDLGAQYVKAWKNFDTDRMEQILMEKMAGTEGVIPYRAPHWYDSERHRQIANLIKENNPEAMAIASVEMAQLVPKNAVLIPMPPHTGVVTNDTDTMQLAQRIGQLTGRPVVTALEGAERQSRKAAKDAGVKSTAADLGFRQVAQIPDGMIPIFIDNVVGSGVTAQAAHDAIGNGITLAYAKSTRAAIEGLKNAAPTYIDPQQRYLIPLEERFDMEQKGVKGTRYSIRDDNYMKAVEDGDTDTAQWMVDQKAEDAFRDSKARTADGKLMPVYHGTKADFNIFDTSVSGGSNGTAEGYGIYLTDNPEIATAYGDRRISAYVDMKRPAYGNRKTIKRTELTKLIKATCEAEARQFVEEGSYENINDAIRDTWISNYVYTLGYRSIDEAIRAVADSILDMNDNDPDIIGEVMAGLGIQNYNRAMDFYHNYLTPITGIDGIWKQWKNVDTGKESNILLAFDSSQIKEADAVTYDDQGNVIPLSERFNRKKQDIRYSIRTTEKTYDALNIDPMVYFTGTEEQIEANEAAEKARADEFRKLIEDHDFMALEFIKPDGRSEILSHSTRPGVEWQLTYIGSDGEPTMHQDYGGTNELDGIKAHSMEELYRHFVLENIKSQIKFNVMEDKNIDGGKTSYKIVDDGGPDMDVDRWMMAATEDSFRTEAEKELHRRFVGLKTEMDLEDIRQSETKARIAAIEAEENPTPSQKRTLQGLKVKLENSKTKKKALEKEFAQVTSSEGYAGMMRYQTQRLEAMTSGKSQDEVNNAVEKMETVAAKMQQEIEKTTQELNALTESRSVRQILAMVKKSSVETAATNILRAYNSTLKHSELKNELARIRIKMAAGRDITDDMAELARRIIDNRKGSVRNDALENLRGITIRLGESAMREIYGSHSSLKEIRKMLAGSGVRVVQAKDGGAIDTQWDEILTLAPQLDGYNKYDTKVDKNQIRALTEFVQEALKEQRESGAKELAGQEAGVIADLTDAVKKIDTSLPTDPALRAQFEDLMNYVKEMAGKTTEATQKIAAMQAQVNELIQSGKTAAAWSKSLKADMAETLDYYDKAAKLAIDMAKKKKLDSTIQQLKDKHVQDMMKAQDQWRQQMERDREARNQAEENRATRKKMHTMVSRLYNLLSNPTNTKNIPEQMNSLARHIVGMFIDNDFSDGARKLLGFNKEEDMPDMKRRLDAWNMRDGAFAESDLNGLDDTVQDIVSNRLQILRDAMTEWNQEYKGKNHLDTVQQMGKTLEKMHNAVSDIYNVIQYQRELAFWDRRVAVSDQANKVNYQTGGKKAKERTGKIGRAMAMIHKGIVSGNMTPEYFFRTLGNSGLWDLWEGYHQAENRNGLELARTKARIAEIAEKHGYKGWDTQQRHEIELEKGGTVKLTLGQMMSLWATWNREQTLGPEMSDHLRTGGFYAEEQDLREGINGKTTIEKKAHRVTDTDMARIGEMLTEEQKNFIDDIVHYMSSDMSELGNEASMKAFGIKLYKEDYYFPMQMWDGIKSRKSNDSGSAASRDRAFHPSFSKSRKHGANNALVIGDFMQTVADHVVGMINYATMGLANENLQKVLNWNITEGDNADNMTRRNIRTILEEAYGQTAMQYLRELQDQLNGGAVATKKTLADRAISLFRKNAVAGSLSVALQQPLSYLRAGLMINPKYLRKGILTKEYWKGSYQELLQHSGVAVIKDMGRFDMGFGQSAREYVTPEGKEGKTTKIWNAITDTATILPEKMDAWTWTRMWVAVKQEQHDLHPEMDVHSDEFLDMCGERFNDIMRRTQVYDSTLVKSSNMRSDHFFMKSLTSFMAEPTLTLNVLADAVRQVKDGEKGAMGRLAGAGATFLLSAVLQAAVKGLMGAGRNPDDKKNFEENFLYRFWSNLLSEANPASLIPGYGDMITLLKGGELKDDAMSAFSKLYSAGKTGIDMLLGNGSQKGTYRDVEDSVGQIVQLFTNLPAKNLMRDARAMWNFFIDQPYAQRPTDMNVVLNQAKEQFFNADNLTGVVNKWLGDAGYGVNNAAYYQRIYDAKKAGDETRAQSYIDYLMTGKGVKEKTITSAVNKLAKEDEQTSATEKAQFLNDEGADAGSYIVSQVKAGEITGEQARKLLAEAEPDKDADSIWWTVDRAEYKRDTGKDAGTGKYYRLYDAMDANNAEQISSAVNLMTAHGMDKKNIKTEIGKHYKAAYLAADSNGKRKIRDAMQKAYRKLGFTAADADKTINGWK